MNKPIIFRFLALSLLAISAVVSFAAPSNKVVTLNFDEDMFEITVEDGVVQDVLYTKNSAALPNDTTLPSLPIVAFTVAAGPHVDCTFSPKVVSKKLILEDVDIITAPPAYPTSMLGKVTLGKRGNYAGDVYPSEICTLTGKSEWSDATHLHFLCSPFIYDGKARRLYLIEQLDVDITTTDALSKQKLASENFDFMTPSPEFIQTFPGLIDTSLLSKGDSLKKFPIGDEDYAREFMYDYLIITSEKLASTFEPLLRWKKAKGLQTHLETVESISKHYSGVDTPAKIKDFLRKNATRMGIKYVLLGGDDTVVPVRYCDGNHNKKYKGREKDIPTDLYYACINDPYDWDKNGNGIYGERSDSVSMAPSFAVTRVPVSAQWSAKIYVDRVLEYERAPKWNNRLLLWGNVLDIKDGTKASTKGRILYDKYLSKYHSFDKEELYDDSNTLGYDVTNRVEIENLKKELDSGYNFISAITHGDQTSWRTGTRIDKDGEEEHDVYTYQHASGMNNPDCHTIITTMACLTNAFDTTDLLPSDFSLSEIFLRKINSGVIAYLGCSRNGYFRSGTNMDLSFSYEIAFYEELFNSQTSNSLGSVVKTAKYKNISYANSDTLSRYIMYGLNPVGDPEMPIFTQEPSVLNVIDISINDRTIDITNDEPDCTICIQGLGSKPTYNKVYKNSYSASAKNLPDQFSVCVTKQNYIPWIYGFNRQPDGSYRMTELSYDDILKENFGLRSIRGQITDIKFSSGALIAKYHNYDISTMVSDDAKEAYLRVSTIDTNSDIVGGSNKYDIKTGEDVTTIKIPAASPITQVTVVELIVDDVVEETIKLR
ncbi:MAG: hypothetical protein K2M49_04880 [Muribaculaceae bacterium]|nr:hypothetical protein [Muribaculaceae bacterium]